MGARRSELALARGFVPESIAIVRNRSCRGRGSRRKKFQHAWNKAVCFAKCYEFRVRKMNKTYRRALVERDGIPRTSGSDGKCTASVEIAYRFRGRYTRVESAEAGR